MARATLASHSESTGLSGAAHRLLTEPINKENELKRSFLAALEDADILQAIENGDTFSDLLRYGLDRGLVSQKALSERLRYANSQIGRWAAGKATPQYIIRERVLSEMRAMLKASIGEPAND